ncbi:hypothetical protein M758_7G161200 [Ceratodon purpureus]|nr:hypothetical protein M758_7G161200 [Ceratodon purpureus]
MATMFTPTKDECKVAENLKKDVASKMETIQGMLNSFEQEVFKITWQVCNDYSFQVTMSPSQAMTSELEPGHKIQNMINELITQINVLRKTHMIKRIDELKVGLKGSQVLKKAMRYKIISKHEAQEFEKQLKNLDNRHKALLQLHHRNQHATWLLVD